MGAGASVNPRNPALRLVLRRLALPTAGLALRTRPGGAIVVARRPGELQRHLPTRRLMGINARFRLGYTVSTRYAAFPMSHAGDGGTGRSTWRLSQHMAPRRGGLVLDPADFYILASRGTVKVPPTHAAEMIAYDTLVGEFRVHYAGFFDPGFGHPDAGGEGSRAVLEVRSYEVPFVIEHDQLVGRLNYEPLTQPPTRLYGREASSSYQGQGIALGKHFKEISEADLR